MSQRRHRALLWVAAPHAEAMARAHALWQARAWQAPLWLGPVSGSVSEPGHGLSGVAPLPAGKARTQLGGEHDLVVFDAVSPQAGFDPDAFGAISGTLRAGGLLVLLTPDAWLADTPAPDADYARLAAWPHTSAALSAGYLARLARRLYAAPQVLRWGKDDALAVPAWLRPAYGEQSRPVRETPRPEDSDCLTPDQAQAVARLIRLR
ncbi:MAG: tRNA(Met) cytidine acetyltransferase TmcA domain-containing protein, partial [Halomonas sp.]|nr:tRNA(Met) cytidine acetyltransferase TmcA domain-containing protein [Halomonas sp.]